MQKLSKIFLILGIVAAILIVGGLIGMLAGGSRTKTGSTPAPVTESRPATETTAAAAPKTTPGEPPKTNAISTGETKAGTSLPAGVMTNWDERVEEILGADVENTNKVAQLFELFPHVPAESKHEVLQHLSNLVGDEDYAPMAELLKDVTLDSDAMDVLLQDALGRPNSLKLPALLEVAKISGHPKADEAKDLLSLFLEEDYGDDWPKWQEKLAQWLKDNPD
ncbi:MAG: hypothetical protein U1F65_06860 [Verrucomicrobiota bacterium]